MFNAGNYGLDHAQEHRWLAGLLNVKEALEAPLDLRYIKKWWNIKPFVSLQLGIIK